MAEAATTNRAVIAGIALAVVACGQAATPVYPGAQQADSEVATLNAGSGLIVAAIHGADGRAACGLPPARECPQLAALLPGRYRVVLRPADWPSSARRWAIDADIERGHSYTARVSARQRGEAGRGGGPEIEHWYQTAVELVDTSGDARTPVAAGVPEQEAAALPPREPLARDPKGPRCPPYAAAAGCVPLPKSWYSTGEARPAL